MTERNNRRLLLFLWVFGFVVYSFPQWQTLDERVNDHWRRQIAATSQVSSQLLLIEIDDRSLEVMEPQIGRWPWPRSIHGFLLEGLMAAQAKAVVFDIFFSERDRYQPESDQFFAETVAQYHNVFFSASLLSKTSPVESTPLTRLPADFLVSQAADSSGEVKINLPWVINPKDWRVGLINYQVDDDGVIRRYALTTREQGLGLKSLPLQVMDSLSLLPSTPDLDELEIKYKGKELVPFDSLSFVDAAELLNQQRELELFKDKLVVIGATATGLHDLHPTPIAAQYPGTSVLATVMDNLLTGESLRTLPRYYGSIVIAICALWFCWLSERVREYRRLVAYLALLMLGLAGLIYSASRVLADHNLLFSGFSTLAVVLLLAVGALLNRGFSEYLNRQHALKTFSRFMDPQVVQLLLQDSDWENKIAHKSTEISVLFSDIRGFTTLSEKRSAEEIMSLLSRYFDLQVSSIFATRGTLDKFIGDAIMAFWGAPLSDSQHAVNAVRAALKMVDNLTEFRNQLPSELQVFDVGIGVHSGPAVVGMLGSSRRFDYTAIGDTVNLASRIEGVTKGIARVLVSEATKNLSESHFSYEYRGEFSVKGREQPVRLFEPVGILNQ